MDRKIGYIAIALIIIIVAFIGFTVSKNPTNSQLEDKPDSYTVNSNGGRFIFNSEKVELNIPQNSVTQQFELSVEESTNPNENSPVQIFTCYDFRPDGQIFTNPIELIIKYNPNELPKDVKESDIKVYVYTDNQWLPIEESFVDTVNHIIVAQVYHFSKMAGGAPSPSSVDTYDPEPDNEGDDDNSTSAQYWFKADTEYYTYNDPRHNEKDDDTRYSVGFSAYWTPVSYVQYYQIKFVYNSNTPENYAWHCDYTDQGKDYCTKNPYPFHEGYIYHLEGDPNLEGFIGLLKTGNVTLIKIDPDTGERSETVYAHTFPYGKHGYNFFGVHEVISDLEGLSDLQVGAIVSEMETFVIEYTNGWEIWVRGVTESGN